MTITIELSPEEERRLHAARQAGEELSACVHRLLSAALPPARDAAQATRELLRSWDAEDRANSELTDEQVEAELAEFKRAMNAPRAEARLLFPEVS